MNLLFCTDLHICQRFGDGRYRRDCLEDLLDKVRFVIKTARERGCSAILVGGDWFDSPHQGYPTQQALVQVMSAWSAGWIGVLGQHDVHGHDLSTYRSSPVSAFWQMDNVSILEPECFREKGSIRIGGVSHTDHLIEQANHALMVAGTEQSWATMKKAYDIFIYHALIDKPTRMAEWKVDPETLPKELTRIALCGDLHEGFTEFSIDDTIYVNPGALARTKPSDSSRTIYCTAIEMEGNEVTLEHIEVPCRPGDEVFDLQRWEDDRAQREELQRRSGNFAAALTAAGPLEGDALDDLVRQAGVDQPDDVVEKSLAYLGKAREHAN